MTEITVQTDPQLWETVKEFSGFKDNVALINEALTFLKFTLEWTANNKIVGWMDKKTRDYDAFSMDCIEYAKPKMGVKDTNIKPAKETLAELMKRLNQSAGRMAQTLKINEAEERDFNKLVYSGGFDSGQAAVNEAVRGLSLALGKVYQGYAIGAIDPMAKRFIELSLPSFEYVARHRPQTAPSKPTLKPPESDNDIPWSEWIEAIRKNPPNPDKENER